MDGSTDLFGRPKISGGTLPDLGPRAYREPEQVVQNLKLYYQAGEEVTLTAHVKNFGFAPAQPFEVVWRIDDRELGREPYPQLLEEMEETTFGRKWKWQTGFHHVTVQIVTAQPEIATLNNTATDPLWRWGLLYIVHPGRVNVWHQKHRLRHFLFRGLLSLAP